MASLPLSKKLENRLCSQILPHGLFLEWANLPNKTFVKPNALLPKLQVPTKALGVFWLGASTESLAGCFEASCAGFPFIHNCCEQ